MNTVHLPNINPDRAKDCLIRADLLMKARNYDGALQAIRDCFNFQPNNIDACLLAARIYLHPDNNQPEAALAVLNGLEKFSPPSETSLLLKAKAFFKMEQFGPCNDCLDEVFARKRDHQDALGILAGLYLKTNKSTEAIHIYERLLKTDSGNTDLLYSLGLSYFQVKDWDEVIYYCSQIIDNGGGHPLVQDLYQKALKEKKKLYITKRGDVTFLQKIHAMIFDPITDRELRIHSDNERQANRTARQSFTDENTGALNFRAMKEYIPNYFLTAKKDIYLAQLDIDYFKAFNEYYSHQVGDEVLRALAAAGGSLFPQKFFRKGGEEFVWVIEGDEKDALEKAKEWRALVETKITEDAQALIEKNQIRHSKTQELYKLTHKVTISQGLCKFEDGTRTLDQMLEKADNNLNMAKTAGRNAIFFNSKLVEQGEKPPKPILDGR